MKDFLTNCSDGFFDVAIAGVFSLIYLSMVWLTFASRYFGGSAFNSWWVYGLPVVGLVLIFWRLVVLAGEARFRREYPECYRWLKKNPG